MLWRRKRKFVDPLDLVLMWLTAADPLTVRHLLNSLCVFGRTGSGKSSGIGRTLMLKLAACKAASVLILGAKPEDRPEWEAAFRAAGRAKDLVVVEPDGEWRLNLLDLIIKSGGDPRMVTQALSNIAQTLRTSDSDGGEDSGMWEQQRDRQIYNATVILMAATGGVSAPDLQRFITGAARNANQISDPTWRAGFHATCITTALDRAKPGRERHDVELAASYFLSELPSLNDRTRSSIEVGTLGLLHALNVGYVRTLLSADTTISPDDLLAGKSILIDMPVAKYGDTGACVNAGVKWAVQTHLLKRVFKPGEQFVVVWADEAQTTVSSYDSVFLAQCRSHGAGMCYLAQSKHSYYAALHGEKGRHQVDALLSNFGLKVFNALGDIETAEWASNLCGKERKLYMGGSSSEGEDVFDAMCGYTRFSGSFSEQLHPVVEGHEFINGLRTGSAANSYVVDAICVRSAEAFSNGRNFIRTSFKQR